MPARKYKYVGISPRCEEERLASTNKPTGRYRARFPITGRTNKYTTKILKATKRRDAMKEALEIEATDQENSFTHVANLWISAGCPTKKQAWQLPSPQFRYESELQTARLIEYFGTQPIATVNRLIRCTDFQSWAAKKYGTRSADKGAQTLSNLINYALHKLELVEINFVRSNRDRLHKIQSRARQRMPADANAIHRLADYFLTESQTDGRALRSEVFGWLVLFQMFTKCRTSELLRFRTDAQRLDRDNAGPGYIENQTLYLGRRSKNGVNPYIPIEPVFAQMIACFHRWHADRFPKVKEYFPGPSGPLDTASYCKAVSRAAAKLQLSHITPHGIRAYGATKELRDGKTHAEVAAMLGDKTAALIGSTYADAPGEGEKLHYLPTQGLPAWTLWADQQQKIARIA